MKSEAENTVINHSKTDCPINETDVNNSTNRDNENRYDRTKFDAISNDEGTLAEFRLKFPVKCTVKCDSHGPILA